MATMPDTDHRARIKTPPPPGPAARTEQPRVRRWWPWVVILLWAILGGGLISQAANLPEVVESGATAYLPSDSASKQVVDLTDDFGDEPALPAVIVWTKDGGLSEAELVEIATFTDDLSASIEDRLTSAGAIGPVPSEDGTSAQVVLPIAGTDTAVAAEVVGEIRDSLEPAEDVVARVAGPAAVQADMQEALGAIDLMLVLVTCSLILVILLAVYRSIVLPFLVILVGVIALGAAHGAVYLLASAGIIRIGAEVQGIMSVLVLGCATDYAMLLIHRFNQYQRSGEPKDRALALAWRRSWEPIVASASTVVVGLVCLLLSSLGLNRQLGPAAAIGVVISMVAMLTLMPAILQLLGRFAFWPRRPDRGGGHRPGIGRVDRQLLARPRTVWVVTSVALLACASGVLGLRTGVLTDGDMVIGDAVESRLGQEQLDAHFPEALAAPAIVLVQEDQVEQATDVIESTEGVSQAVVWDGSTGDDQAVVVDGRVRIDAFLEDDPDSGAAAETVRQLREGLESTSSPQTPTLVGGQSAVRVDFNDAAEADRMILVLIIAVVFVIIALLLRSAVASLVVVASVVLSFFAALGVSTLVFQELLGFPGVDSTFPIHAFVFLVALGVDYSIFLMSRVRETVMEDGPRLGVVRGLSETSHVITSAGIVLAATFAALALVPIVLMVQLAFIVAFGLVLDTMIVRTLLVPAVSIDLGRVMWWPSRVPRDRVDAANPGDAEVPADAEGDPASR